jgi:hypothetical protein
LVCKRVQALLTRRQRHHGTILNLKIVIYWYQVYPLRPLSNAKNTLPCHFGIPTLQMHHHRTPSHIHHAPSHLLLGSEVGLEVGSTVVVGATAVARIFSSLSAGTR